VVVAILILVVNKLYDVYFSDRYRRKKPTKKLRAAHRKYVMSSETTIRDFALTLGLQALSTKITSQVLNPDVSLVVFVRNRTLRRFRRCLHDDRAAEDSAAFQTFYRFIDLLERVSPRYQIF
jgi:hypothetical protein